MPQATKREFPNPEHLQYWPYAEEQYSRTLVTFERFKSWKNVIIVSFFFFFLVFFFFFFYFFFFFFFFLIYLLLLKCS